MASMNAVLKKSSENIGHPVNKIVKEGWLLKRGEHIKNWRTRYFILKDNGELKGYKSKPDPSDEDTTPLNTFTVQGCQILPIDKPKPCTFIIRGLQWQAVIERTFNVETEEERKEWINAIE